MDKNPVITEILIDTAVADIAINDLGLTLDNPVFFSPYCSFVEYGIDSEFGDVIRFETLVAMSWHLCTLKDGVAKAQKLAKKSGLLNYKLSDTEIVTEDFIKEGIINCIKTLSRHEATKWDLEMSVYYQKLFRGYCLEYMDADQLKDRIKTKIETYIKR